MCILLYLIRAIKDNPVLATLAFTAIVASLPKPGTPLSWRMLYEAFYDSITTFWNLKHPPGPNTPQ